MCFLPAIAGLFGLLINGWHSDKTGERRWHTAIPLLCVGVSYLLLIPASAETAGHGTTGQAKWWKKELGELLQSAPKGAH